MTNNPTELSTVDIPSKLLPKNAHVVTHNFL